MRTNRGRGSKINVAKELKTLMISCSSPIVPPKNIYDPTMLISMKQKAIGIPVAIKNIREPNITRITKYHSKRHSPHGSEFTLFFGHDFFLFRRSPYSEVAIRSSQELD